MLFFQWSDQEISQEILLILMIFLENHYLKSKFVYLQIFGIRYKALAGDYCEGVIPDPIPNSEVKPFSADGTLS